MVTDQQVRRLMSLMNQSYTLSTAACKSGMSERTARKYMKENQLPSQMKTEHNWRNRKDPFEMDWDQICQMLELDGSARKPGMWMMGHLVEPIRLMKDMEKMGVKFTTSIQ